jgi:plastocyanin
VSPTAKEQDGGRCVPPRPKIPRSFSASTCRGAGGKKSLRSLRGRRGRAAFGDFGGFLLAFTVILLVMAGVTYLALTSGPYTVVTPLPSTTSTSLASSGSSTATSSASSASPSPATTSVEIPKGAGTGPSAAPGYAPDKVTVVIGVNNTVTWTNDDTVAHTVTSVSGNGTVSSGNLVPGGTYTFTFSSPGTYDYYCEYHSWMSATVIVKSG